jgi:hypothetical protein
MPFLQVVKDRGCGGLGAFIKIVFNYNLADTICKGMGCFSEVQFTSW